MSIEPTDQALSVACEQVCAQARADLRACLVNLPIKPQDLHRLDEKWRVKGGYTGLDRAFGVDWNSIDE